MRPTAVFVALCALLIAFPVLSQSQPMAAYWPHEDGREWIYDQHYEELIPPGEVVDNVARLYFDGVTVAPIGIDAQVLRGEVLSPPARRLAGAPVPAEIADPLLRTLWVARPDLRPGILGRLATAGAQPCPNSPPTDWFPILLAGGLAYVQTPSEIAAWRCDRANTRSWLWLTSDLTPGSTAMLQLVPDLADDVFLHLTVGELETVHVPAGTYPNCVRVDYRVDYGESECVGETGVPTGTFRAETAGAVHYAPGIGPVRSEEVFHFAEIAGECMGVTEPGVPLARATLDLRTAPAVPALPLTWGRLKSTYRD